MYKIIIFVVSCTLFVTGSAETTMNGPEIQAARREFRRCYDDIIHYIKTGNASNKICRDKEDFKNKIDEYAETELRINNRTVPRNEFFIKHTLFTFSHRYSKAYFLMLDEGKDCFGNSNSKEKTTEKGTSKTHVPQKLNLIQNIFTKSDAHNYTVYACDTFRLKKERLESAMPSDCNDYTRRFFIDMCEEYLEDCKKYNIIHVNRIEPRVNEKTSWLNLTTVLALIVAALIIIIIVASLGIILIIKYCYVYPNNEKNAEELPKKTSVPQN